MDYLKTYVDNPLVEENAFLTRTPQQTDAPFFEQARALLPQPHWDANPTAIACYWKIWEIAFGNIGHPTPENDFVSSYIDTAFNNNIFMWDSAFILLFARYGTRAFNFQQTLDNFYRKQHSDGFICREIRQSDGSDCFYRHDPSSTGPNIMPWTEWEYYLNFGDKKRLAEVFPPLLAYYRWFRANRTWRDGAYWSTGWGCGMDNQARFDADHDTLQFTHGHLIWADTNMQQIFAARVLWQMAETLGRTSETSDLSAEINALTRLVNDRLWDEATAFYYDLNPDDKLSFVKSIGAYWGLLAQIVNGKQLTRFIAHLEDPASFNRPHRVPTLAANHHAYNADTGDYWNGGVWPPTNYMVLRGLTAAGCHALAYEIARNHLDNVLKVFEQTETVWENYAPERIVPGHPAKPDFVGWSGLPGTAVLIEYVFGLRADVPSKRLVWDVRLTDAHGVTGYPFGLEGVLDLQCSARQSLDEKPHINVNSNVSLTLELRWEGGRDTIMV